MAAAATTTTTAATAADASDIQQDPNLLRANVFNLGRMVVVTTYMVTLVVSFIPNTLIGFDSSFYSTRLLVGISMTIVFSQFPRSHNPLNSACVALFLVAQALAISVNLSNAFGSACMTSFDASCPDDVAAGRRVPRRVFSAVVDLILAASIVTIEVNRQAALRKVQRGSRVATTDKELAAQV
ncbi:hypothetical protein HK105_203170 [Polyrhizophydium stewartii]|uniref:Uncharacterized protein n=1 Tax=Polyrhizophydium stewartii TaxID=2732419 RepID=A0ABR4NC88_9FUNG|nr:hypothetical protein HK105_003395 [Polyrhizophydium stewartii]